MALTRPDSSALWARVGAVVGLSAGMTVMCEEQRGALLLLLLFLSSPVGQKTLRSWLEPVLPPPPQVFIHLTVFYLFFFFWCCWWGVFHSRGALAVSSC